MVVIIKYVHRVGMKWSIEVNIIYNVNKETKNYPNKCKEWRMTYYDSKYESNEYAILRTIKEMGRLFQNSDKKKKRRIAEEKRDEIAEVSKSDT